ncbi:MAG TPA: crosslink repair DNA glycosylase YcaQ family protein [Pyrinomonadaceae bacterium]|nr:crosslink repair DNA glycosylase YcaQ family protein [Pyrinomonadaceae bacterium]
MPLFWNLENTLRYAIVVAVPITLDDLRRYAVARNFPKPTTLNRALQQRGFVQADPIRAPARAQDLILRHRVKNYHAGDLERRYPALEVEEDFFVNYGYVSRSLQTLMHPRTNSRVPAVDIGAPWPSGQRKNVKLLLDFVRERGPVHPREVDEHFAHGRVTNYWGGSSNATTHLLDAMHYTGLLRIVRREKGIRIYAAYKHAPVRHGAAERRARIDALVDAIVRIYAPLPGPSLNFYLRRLQYAVPQWKKELPATLQRAKQRLSNARVDNVDWYLPVDEKATGWSAQEIVRLLAPFDPLVHDRARFELLWGWVYRFEAYTPAPKRKLGYYAMPLLWRDRVIGWANLSVKNGELVYDLGYVDSMPPRDLAFKRELESELDRFRDFLRL